jgi:hypothetical protein
VITSAAADALTSRTTLRAIAAEVLEILMVRSRTPGAF